MARVWLFARILRELGSDMESKLGASLFYIVAGLALAVTASAAGPDDVPLPDDGMLASYYFASMDLADGMQLETRLDADLNGDTLTDVAFVAGNEEFRVLCVVLAYRDEFDMGHSSAGKAELGGGALGPASLSAPKGVLVVDDLTGGTTAISSTYRYRHDRKSGRMRLIGDDVKLYSRTNAHGWHEISTNRLTGLRTSQRAEVDEAGEFGAYKEEPMIRSKVATTPIYMEDAPKPETTLEWGD